MNILIIKADGIENIEHRVNFADTNVVDLIKTVQGLEVEAVEILLPNNTPPKTVKAFSGSIAVLTVIGIEVTIGTSLVNEYVKGGFVKGDSPDSLGYWALRGYLPQVHSPETTELLTKEIAEKILMVSELAIEVNDTLSDLSRAGQLVATKSWYDVGTHHHTMRSGKSSQGIDGIITYEASDLWVKQLAKFNK
jgi:hypothetical protein